MWNNRFFERDVQWAYGRKLLIIRLSYVLLFAAAIGGTLLVRRNGVALQRSRLADELIPISARILAPFFAISLVMINALAVNSITNERDGQALDLLLATQITPTQFFGWKAIWCFVRRERDGCLADRSDDLPLVTRWHRYGEHVVYDRMFTCDDGVLRDVRHPLRNDLQPVTQSDWHKPRNAVLFVSRHCDLHDDHDEFPGSFARQLPPFLAIILGGGTGLFVALGSRNPSPAIALASFGLPFLTFFAITSFILRDQELTVFSVIVAAYGFATTAMIVPALSEFDFDLGRSAVRMKKGSGQLVRAIRVHSLQKRFSAAQVGFWSLLWRQVNRVTLRSTQLRMLLWRLSSC